MRIPLQRGAEGLDDSHHAGASLGLVDTERGGSHPLADGLVGESCHLSKELSVVQEIGPEHSWNGKNPLGVGDVSQDLTLESVGKDHRPLGAARGA